jgi:hypothetical protein
MERAPTSVTRRSKARNGDRIPELGMHWMTTKIVRTTAASAAMTAALLGWLGCDGGTSGPADGTPPVASGPGVGFSAPADAPAAASPDRPSSPTKAIMARLNGPGALDKAVGKALASEQPDWDTIQKQTSEYARLAADFGKHDPPKGTKASWTELTSAFAESAAELDRSARARDKAAAMLVRDQIGSSCMRCHREHRPMPMGRGGFGMPPRGGPPGGGPPGGGPPGGGSPEGGPPGGGSPGGGPPRG